ncbi:peptide ABC transporter permease [Alicyclobacillus cellulosilyticus]|uniref:Peptide ABC transporter permease n=1 Tax=Alicyclobacillus cellulosilyticus TaxID=1003997 RepID=A0A917NIV8_9BACL|nr:peptide ABC transporter permease [Alicyclobacillus cellulosilyticus]
MGFVILVFFILMATVGPRIFPFNTTVNFSARYQPPSWHHWLGTDYAGRDIWTEIVYGSRDVLLVAFWTAVITLFIGTLVGMLAGLIGGFVDQVIVALINLILTIPGFSLSLILAAVFSIQNAVEFGLLLSITAWAPLALGVRSQVLSLREREFVTIARIMGMSKFHIIFKELMPNVISFLTVSFIGVGSGAIQASVGIMLLGLAPFSATNWGEMLTMAVQGTGGVFNPRGVYYLISPIVCMSLFTLGCFLFANGIDDFFNPRLRRQ